MAGRAPTKPTAQVLLQTPGVSDKQTQRALNAISAAVQRLESIAGGSAPSGTGFVRVTSGAYDTPLDDAALTTHVDAFTSALKGAAPASGGGTTNFLRADGTWAAPTGSGTIADGDYGDITVSGGGAVLNIDAGVITATELASDAVTTVKILDANVTTAKIADNNVTLAKLVDIATQTFLGRTTAGTSDPEVLTATQATAILNAFTDALKGLVPASGGGVANFLRADGTWAAPAGSVSLGLVVALANHTAL